jgi:thiamine biosynthesis lipoprotein
VDSVASAINAAAGTGERIGCDEETMWLLNFANTLHASSDGLFDMTSGVLRRVWNFEKAVVPSQEEIDKVLPLIDWSSVELGKSDIRLPRKGMEVDFGGFGKEYAADAAAAKLQKSGVKHGYVNLGGDIRVIGPQPDGSAWNIAIQDPRNRDEIVATIPMFQGGLTTSGDYEKFFELDGRRYCHIMNPKTGLPVRYWQSISIVAPLAIVAGSCSTITMLLEAQGKDWMENSGFSYLGISCDGNRVSS